MACPREAIRENGPGKLIFPLPLRPYSSNAFRATSPTDEARLAKKRAMAAARSKKYREKQKERLSAASGSNAAPELKPTTSYPDLKLSTSYSDKAISAEPIPTRGFFSEQSLLDDVLGVELLSHTPTVTWFNNTLRTVVPYLADGEKNLLSEVSQFPASLPTRITFLRMKDVSARWPGMPRPLKTVPGS